MQPWIQQGRELQASTWRGLAQLPLPLQRWLKAPPCKPERHSLRAGLPNQQCLLFLFRAGEPSPCLPCMVETRISLGFLFLSTQQFPMAVPVPVKAGSAAQRSCQSCTVQGFGPVQPEELKSATWLSARLAYYSIVSLGVCILTDTGMKVLCH